MSLVRLRLRRSFPLIGVVTAVAFAGCVSTTSIQSMPPGARVYLDGMPAGTTPVTMSDTKIVGATTRVKIEAPGYQTLETVISRNEDVDVLALIGGLFLLVPFFWVMGYRPIHMYQLQPLAPGASPPGAPAPGYYPPPGYPPPAGYPPPPPGYPPPPPGYPPPAYPPPQ